MATSLNTQPIVLDQDLANFGSAQTLQNKPFGFRITKLMLVAATSTTAGTVTITYPADNKELYPAIIVAASAAAGTSILSDNTVQPLTWRNFKVTGLTATGTKLYLWYRT